jgi:phage-related protein (TIGR01555 family)
MAEDSYPGWGFPGFPYLSMLATRAEFRAFAAAMSTELTREWIVFSSTDSEGDSGDKIKEIDSAFSDLKVREVVMKAAAQDCFFGRAQIFLDIAGSDRNTPLILDPRTIKKGSLSRIAPVEAIWTTPSAYNSIDPAAPDFYKPSRWFMLGQEVHATRLLTVVTRELPDILKPAFNFAGMSLSQLAEPYVDNWLRTRQSVSNLINNFSITALKTNMSQVLQAGDDGTSVLDRAQLFTLTRSNQGLMLLDKELEDLVQMNVPLSGLHELQAQSQEQMCSVSHIPSVILTGIAPSGFGNVADGEIAEWYDWVAAQQEAYWRPPLEIILKAVQLSLFGEIDPGIRFNFLPLKQMNQIELADIRLKNSQAGTAYIDRGVIDPTEERERLANDPESGYQGLDMDREIVTPSPEEHEDHAQDGALYAGDAEWEEGDHSRDHGQFASSNSGGSTVSAEKKKEIADLCGYALAGHSNVQKKVQYATVSKSEAEKLEKETGLEFDGYKRIIDNYAIKHMIKQHGNAQKEAARGQLPVTEEDIQKIPEIVSRPDSIQYAGKNGQGRDTIRYEKRFNGTIYYFEEARSGQNELAADTMYIRAATPRATSS